ncbi:MAG: radical SAM protein [Myxococcota bacterium]|nr:radical SAM protein [Myxococcota bacterium]
MKDTPRPPVGAMPEAAPPVEDPTRLARHPTRARPGEVHPLYCVWEITLACDLGCRHCGSRAGDARPEELTTEQCLGVVDQLKELGIREVTLIGGEAYLREDWHVIAAYIRELGMVCGMTTGAFALTEERVQQAVDAGMTTISVSIDGLEATHDAQRGRKGSWRAAVEASERIAQSSIRLCTNTQINRLSMPELPALAELLIQIGSRAWQTQLTVPMGNAADRPDLLLQPYDLLELFPLLMWIKQEKLVPNRIHLMPGNNIGYFGPYEEVLRFGGHQGAHWSSCSAGRWSIGLEADGKIKGCPSLPSNTYTGGNLHTDGLVDTVQNSDELRYMRERTVDDLWGYCRTCYYADVCKAGCSWTSHVFFDKPGNNPYCIHRALDHEKRGQRERLRKVVGAPGRPFDNGRFEITAEPIPEVDGDPSPTIGGVQLDKVMKLATTDRGTWAKADLTGKLKTS